MTRDIEKVIIEAINSANDESFKDLGGPEILARINQYDRWPIVSQNSKPGCLK